MPKKLTPDEITEKLLKYDPENDYPADEPEVEHTTQPTVTVQQTSLSDKLKFFLEENNAVLTVSPVSENFKTVSDGSVILSAPKIIIQSRN